MNKLIYLIIFLLTCSMCKGQILCIYCYDQNDSLSDNVNNLILNGGFENSNCTPGYIGDVYCPNSTYYSCDINNWTCTGGGLNTYACLFNNSPVCRSVIVEGGIAAYLGNFYTNACSPTIDDTSCIIDIACEVTGVPFGYPVNTVGYGGTAGVSLSQTVSGLNINSIYVLEFWAGGEQDNLSNWDESGIFAVDVGFGDTLLRCNPTPQLVGIGKRYVIEFNATSSSQTIKFTNWGHICSQCTELVLDDVRLYRFAELNSTVPRCIEEINNFSTSQNMISISPNPVTNELTVKTKSNELSEIILYDFASRKILQQKFTNSVSLRTDQLAKGIYLFEVRDRNGLCNKGKVVKD